MNKSKFVMAACLVAALAIFLIPRSHDAQTSRAPRLNSRAMEAALSGSSFIQCMNATNVSLSQKALSRLQIVSDVVKDPYCCEKEAISEERKECLEENVEILRHMCEMLDKTYTDKMRKCYGQPTAPHMCLCTPAIPLTMGLAGEIQSDATCVRDLITKITNKYNSFTACPNN